MSSRAIANALKGRLGGIAIPKAWPNQDFDPKAPGNLPYLSIGFLRTSTGDETLGGAAPVHVGRFIVTVVSARDTADGASDDHADQIAVLYPRGLRIPAAGKTITITAPPHIREGMGDGIYWRVPVIIPWQAS